MSIIFVILMLILSSWISVMADYDGFGHEGVVIFRSNGEEISTATNPLITTGNTTIQGTAKVTGNMTINNPTANPVEVRTPHAVIVSTVTAVTPVLSTWYSTPIPAGAQWADVSAGQGLYDYDVTNNTKILFGYYADQGLDFPLAGATTLWYQQTVTTPNVQIKFKKWTN